MEPHCVDLYGNRVHMLEAVATEHSRQKISISYQYVALLDNDYIASAQDWSGDQYCIHEVLAIS